MEAKAAEENKVFAKLLADYPGTDQGYIAEYYLAGVAASQAKMEEARKKYQDVIDHAGQEYRLAGQVRAGPDRASRRTRLPTPKPFCTT